MSYICIYSLYCKGIILIMHITDIFARIYDINISYPTIGTVFLSNWSLIYNSLYSMW